MNKILFKRLAPHHKRHGGTLIELSLLLPVIMVIVGLSISLVIRTMHQSSRLEQFCRDRQNISLLAQALRRDSIEAIAARWAPSSERGEGMLTLETSSSKIEYSIESFQVQRRRETERETYRFSQQIEPDCSVGDHPKQCVEMTFHRCGAMKERTDAYEVQLRMPIGGANP
jgi:hypothetical protein